MSAMAAGRGAASRVRLLTVASGDGSPVLRAVAFVGLAAFATGHWAALVTDPPGGRLALVVMLAGILALALSALRQVRMPRLARAFGALALSLAAAVMAVGVVGLPLGLLDPRDWGDLGARIADGLAGIQTAEWPYDGRDATVKLTMLLAVPATVVPAAALAFWPAGRGRGLLRTVALALLLVLYGFAVTEYEQGAAAGRGLALLALIAAWIWLPRLRRGQAVTAAGIVLVVGLVSMPLASRLDTATPLVDYRGWDWFGGENVTFDWDHSYGPMDWEREGTTLLNVRADRPLYWKAETLDTFDGLRWRRSEVSNSSQALGEIPDELEPRWNEEMRVTVRALETNFVVGSGTPYRVDGAGQAVSGSADGTLRRLDRPLERGDSYTVRAYVPDPSPRRMRASPQDYGFAFGQYTRVLLPEPGATALSAETPEEPATAAQVPLWGEQRGRSEALQTLRDSAYAPTYRLAQRLTAGARTPYDAARSIERYLLSDRFSYSERPPTRELPLQGFLFDDRIGYCQQFSGAMALMLRMRGIPARVVSGFAPGTLNRDTGEYRVRDLDAHSWVEVYFPDIGWATFDPTPAASPAVRAGLNQPDSGGVDAGGAANIGGGGGGDASGGGASQAPREFGAPGRTGSAAADDGRSMAWPILAGLVLTGALAYVIATLARAFAARRRRAPETVAAQLAELDRALPRLGWTVGGADTLLALEHRFAQSASPHSAAYARRLRAARFEGESPRERAGARRKVRRELARRRGLRGRLTGLLVLPLGGPRLRR